MLTSSPCIFFPFQIFKFLLILIQNSKSFSNGERERERERERIFVQRNAEFIEQRISKKNDTFCSVWVFWSLDFQSLEATAGLVLGRAYGSFRGIHQPGKPNPPDRPEGLQMGSNKWPGRKACLEKNRLFGWVSGNPTSPAHPNVVILFIYIYNSIVITMRQKRFEP